MQQLFVHERLFPFRGPWHLPWIIERYIRAAKSAFSVRKLLNASLALAEMRLGKARVRSHPFVLRIEPTNTCNLRCPLCLCGNGRDTRKKGFISIEDFRAIFEHAGRSAIITRLDGLGESTLHPQIFDLIRIAKSNRTSVVMHTNFNTPVCADPEPFLDCGLDRLVVSVDGMSQATHSQYRVGGDVEVVIERLRRLVAARRQRGQKRPIIEMQTVDFAFNREEQPRLRQLSREIGADRYQITEVERSIKAERYDTRHPRRCAWLWTVLTVAWNLDYRSCTNAWSLPWPRHNLRDLPPAEYWNDPVMQEARRFNIDKSSSAIAGDTGCRCNRCYEMMVVPLKGIYTCD
jgi:wyosine [tRNA(Phe)-imidazoG37] synthetase (radical SAM superfamily)